MYKNVKVCLCDICGKPTKQNILRVLLTELNQNEMPAANTQFDGTPVDICQNCMSKLKQYVETTLVSNEYDPSEDPDIQLHAI